MGRRFSTLLTLMARVAGRNAFRLIDGVSRR